MGVLWGVIAVLLALVWIVTVFDVLHRRLGAGTTAVWLIIVLVLPFAGALLYWVLRKPPADEAERAYDGERDIRRGAAPPRF